MTKLSANENCYGCSPLAMRAALASQDNISIYPETQPRELKEQLAARYGVTTDNVVVGAGSVKIIDVLLKVFTTPGSEILTFDNTFIAYSQLAAFHHAKCVKAPLTDLRCKPENLYPYINQQTRLIFISNPNNPTGTIISHYELDRFLSSVDKKIIVVVDEAYAEYVTDKEFPDSIDLIKKYDNLIVLRSFSKIYGLAGLRIGYGLMHPENGAVVAKAQIPFSISCSAARAAIAALEDRGFVAMSAMNNAIEREFMFHELSRLGYRIVESQANFIYTEFDCEAEKLEVYNFLYERGVEVCDLAIFDKPDALRITIGAREMNDKVISLLQGHSVPALMR